MSSITIIDHPFPPRGFVVLRMERQPHWGVSEITGVGECWNWTAPNGARYGFVTDNGGHETVLLPWCPHKIGDRVGWREEKSAAEIEGASNPLLVETHSAADTFGTITGIGTINADTITEAEARECGVNGHTDTIPGVRTIINSSADNFRRIHGNGWFWKLGVKET